MIHKKNKEPHNTSLREPHSTNSPQFENNINYTHGMSKVILHF